MKHTPGPWIQVDDYGVPYNRGFRIRGRDKKSICAISSATKRPEEECIANANLISAAPEMLSALEYILFHAPKCQNAGELERCLWTVQNAIAKAEGRES